MCYLLAPCGILSGILGNCLSWHPMWGEDDFGLRWPNQLVTSQHPLVDSTACIWSWNSWPWLKWKQHSQPDITCLGQVVPTMPYSQPQLLNFLPCFHGILCFFLSIVCTCVYMGCMHMCSCVHLCVEATGRHWVVFITFHHSFDTGFLT